MMADESSELELLSDVEEVDADKIDDEPKVKKRTQRRAVYITDRTFETAEAFGEWWNSEGSTGWELDNRYTSKKTGIQTEYYR